MFSYNRYGPALSTFVLTADLNGDGKPDLVIGYSGGGVFVLINTIVPAAAALSSSGLAFGSQPVGGSSTSQVITLTNTGNVPLTVAANCGVSAPKGGNCNITVLFTPGALGVRIGALTVTDNAANSSQGIALSGTGRGLALGVASRGATSATISAGQTVAYTLSIGGAGMTGTLSLSCGGLPTGSSCSPAGVPVNGQSLATVTLNIATTSRQMSALHTHIFGAMSWTWGIAFAGLTIVPRPKRWKERFILRRQWLALPLLAVLASCGRGGSNSSGPQLNPNGTPAGTYAITVKATSGGTNESVMLKLTVQ